jgi:hypothetical protein
MRLATRRSLIKQTMHIGTLCCVAGKFSPLDETTLTLGLDFAVFVDRHGACFR